MDMLFLSFFFSLSFKVRYFTFAFSVLLLKLKEFDTLNNHVGYVALQT